MKNPLDEPFGDMPDFMQELFAAKCPYCGEKLRKQGVLYLCDKCKKAITKMELR